jgi:hypothetical protein
MMEKDVSTIPRFEILTPTGWSEFAGIKSSIKTGIVKIITESDKTLKCTLEHKIKTQNGFYEAKNLTTNDLVEIKNGYEKVKSVFINIDRVEKVFDIIDVKKKNQYFTNGIVSHNCAWLGSSGTLISGACLKTLVDKTPVNSKLHVKQYEMPIPNDKYVIVADVSRGKGLDYSAAQIINVTKMPYNQVCVYRSNLVTPTDYAKELHLLSKMYNNATILVETNDIGAQVADILHYDYEADNLICTESAGARGKRISSGFGKSVERGVRTTKSVKAVGCSILKLLVESQQLIINDFDTIHELSVFSRKGFSYEAETGEHDDLVMGLVLFAWLSDQQFFKELTDINTLMTLRDRSDEEIENDLVPFGMMSNGQEDIDNIPEIIDLTNNILDIPEEYLKLLNNF